MTIIRKNYLTQSDSYRQPTVLNPPLGQRAENARYAIWHFAELIEIDVAQDVSWSKLDGRSYVGEWRTIQAYAVCQPKSTDGENPMLYEGERVESAIVVHIDNTDPRNVELSKGYADIFPHGLYLAGVDDVIGQTQLRVPTISVVRNGSQSQRCSCKRQAMRTANCITAHIEASAFCGATITKRCTLAWRLQTYDVRISEP